MKPYYCFIIILLTLQSCISGDSDYSKTNTIPIHTRTKIKPISWDKMLQQAAKDHEIYDLVELSRDSIILLRRSIGIELSTDNGKKWEWLGKNIFRIDDFTVDNNGVWWGLEKWQGVHEASYCRLHRSLNLGKTWQEYTFNPIYFSLVKFIQNSMKHYLSPILMITKYIH